MTDTDQSGSQAAEKETGGNSTASESQSDDIDFTPEQRRRLGKILSAERDKIRSQFADYDDLKKQLKEIEKSKLTEAEKLQLERDEAKKEAESWKKKAEKADSLELRTKLFSEYKSKNGESLPSHLLKYVKGKTEEDIQKSIELVASDFGIKAKRNIGNAIPPGNNEPSKKNAWMNEHILNVAGRGSR